MRWVQQQVVKRRVKRDFIELDAPRPPRSPRDRFERPSKRAGSSPKMRSLNLYLNDPKWNQMWYLVSFAHTHTHTHTHTHMLTTFFFFFFFFCIRPTLVVEEWKEKREKTNCYILFIFNFLNLFLWFFNWNIQFHSFIIQFH